ncbi:MAG: acetyl/propionyl/methylcrotonyl-CoA carboxylase subunit alpha [Acidimicrobiales bacterium]
MPPIRRLLVANRGEIARRIMRSAHEMGIATVAVYSEGDARCPFVSEAGTAIALAGRSAAETYLNHGALLGAARRARVDAVHPGYGFLSESASFAREVRQAGLAFVGPPPEVIDALGDKLRASRAAVAAGVPVLESVELPSGAAVGQRMGALVYPVILKAAAGGGGKGMRIVRDATELEQALLAARREALGAFGDGRVFAERYLEGARHIEVQILGDSRGNIVHCFERECSIQRRHQKVIEEAPSSAVSAELRDEMGAAALRLARASGYESAGTVEFLLAEDGRYFFLEVNTRLQVEHPVTEAVTGLDLVREQLLIAGGEALAVSQDDLTLSGHAIEARLYAEDVDKGFLPVAGRVEVWREAISPVVRYDAGVETGTVVGTEFDPMLAKVVAHAPTRGEAAARLAFALERTAVHGLVTNREFLVAVLRDEAFLAGETTTSFLDQHRIPAALELPPGRIEVAAAVASLSAEQQERGRASVLASLPSGWRMSVMPPQRRRYRARDQEITVEYHSTKDDRFEAVVLARGSFAEVSDSSEESLVAGIGGAVGYSVVRHGGSPSRPDLTIGDERPAMSLTWSGGTVWVDFDSGESVELTCLPRFPDPEPVPVSGGLVAPMPGMILSVHVAAGDRVETGQLLAVVEAMKMEHRITAPVAGRIRELPATSGLQVASGDLLVTIEPDISAEGA